MNPFDMDIVLERRIIQPNVRKRLLQNILLKQYDYTTMTFRKTEWALKRAIKTEKRVVSMWVLLIRNLVKFCNPHFCFSISALSCVRVLPYYYIGCLCNIGQLLIYSNYLLLFNVHVWLGLNVSRLILIIIQ